MPKKTKFYAVRIGRQGPKIYQSWDDCKANVARYPGAIHKSFDNLADAEGWLQEFLSLPGNQNPWVKGPSKEDTNNTREKRAGPKKVPNAVDSESAISLSPEQEKVLRMVKAGQNVFFTGSAGVGKSVLLREIIKHLGGKSSETLAITASTGIAAVNIGGSTLHSWAGIGLGEEPPKKLAGKFLGQLKYQNVLERWRDVKTLIIDEISMVDGTLFDTLEYIARRLRRVFQRRAEDVEYVEDESFYSERDLPFGGIQLVLSGDFFQLPPVPNKKNGSQIEARFAFEADSWSRCIGKPVTLTKVFRQKDQGFVDLLNAMRLGKLSPSQSNVLRSLSRPVTYADGVEPTELYSLRAEALSANTNRLRQLPDPELKYEAVDIPGRDDSGRVITLQKLERLLERLVVPQLLSLKIGAQVMLIKNLTPAGRLVNGSVGKVTRFLSGSEASKQKIDISSDKGANERETYQQKEDAEKYPEKTWPVVEFEGRELLIAPSSFTVNNSNGDMEACRIQVPLILAWAISVHKSQGQTISRVKVDMGRVFERGQGKTMSCLRLPCINLLDTKAYVALSRATCLEQLQVLKFSPEKVQAHPRVVAWQLKNDNEASDEFNDDMQEDDYDNLDF